MTADAPVDVGEAPTPRDQSTCVVTTAFAKVSGLDEAHMPSQATAESQTSGHETTDSDRGRLHDFRLTSRNLA